jgi:hypothetical protein
VACYAPWLASFGFAVSRWGAKQTYALSGSAAFEHLLKLGYWLVSFQTGETYWGWLLFGGIALSLPLAAVALAGAALRPPWLASWLAAAAIGYAGVSRWVAYPFVPARMLWLLPLYTLLIALGAAARPRWRPAAAAVLALNAVSLAAYFSREGFLNKAYAAPYHEMAARISAGTGGADAVLLVDCCNADIPALLRYLRAPLKVESAGDEASLSALLSRFDARPPRRVWLYRNGHDISPGGVTARLESELGRRYIASREVYLPYSPGERALMKLAGVGAPPASFYVLVRFDKPERGGGL